MKVKVNTLVLSGFVNNVYVNNEGTLLSFSLGVDDSYFKPNGNGGGEWVNRTNWVNCRVFEKKRIENLKDKIEKCEVLINGEIKSNKREVDGKTTYETYILANRIQIILDKKNDGSSDNSDDGIVLDGIEDE